MRLLVGELKLNYVVANLIAIVVCSLVNFLLGDRFVFRRRSWNGCGFDLATAELCSAERTKACRPYVSDLVN